MEGERSKRSIKNLCGLADAEKEIEELTKIRDAA